MKCYGILLPAMLASRNKVIYGYWLLSSDLCETSWIFLHGPVCFKTGPALSRNVVRFVLKPGPFCPGTWSVFILRRGPFCPETWSVSSGPFCPWSILSKYHPFAPGHFASKIEPGRFAPRSWSFHPHYIKC